MNNKTANLLRLWIAQCKEGVGAYEEQLELRQATVAIIEELEAQKPQYVLWGPDGLPTHPEPCDSLDELVQRAAAFPLRYQHQGHYTDSGMRRLSLEELAAALYVEVIQEEAPESEAPESEGLDASKWQKVGDVAVDSGQLLLCDPCYTISEWRRDLTDEGAYVQYIQENLERIGADWQPVCFAEFKGSEECSIMKEAGDTKKAPAYRHKDGTIFYCKLHGKAPTEGAIGFDHYEQPIPAPYGGKTPNQMGADGELKPLKSGDPTGEFSYDGCCEATNSDEQVGELKFTRGHVGAGVAFSSGLGDGFYPVYVRYVDLPTWGRRVAEMRVVMIAEGAE